MPIKWGAKDKAPDEPGMTPDEITYGGASEPAPGEPGPEDSEGHAFRYKAAKESSPDEPNQDDTEGHEKA